jgi:3-oxoacyl-ACP reductase-like protein
MMAEKAYNDAKAADNKQAGPFPAPAHVAPAYVASPPAFEAPASAQAFEAPPPPPAPASAQAFEAPPPPPAPAPAPAYVAPAPVYAPPAPTEMYDIVHQFTKLSNDELQNLDQIISLFNPYLISFFKNQLTIILDEAYKTTPEKLQTNASLSEPYQEIWKSDELKNIYQQYNL